MDNIEKIINKTPDKQGRWKSTTSRLWKTDMCSFLQDKNIENSLEIGTNQGWTSYALSFVSKNVYTIESSEHNFIKAKEHCSERNNIKFIKGDAYDDMTYNKLPEHFDVAVIDCVHTYENVILDINRSLGYFNPNKGMYLIFDDYSHPTSTGVKEAIDEFKNSGGVKVEAYIGHKDGHVVTRPDETSFTLTGPEGIILSYGK
tara:strand:- start:1470 stop:2075 length:606 start_codon:yes stop_codon:yes gene_type:complete